MSVLEKLKKELKDESEIKSHDFRKNPIKIEHSEGNRVLIPKGMSLLAASQELLRIWEDNEQETNFVREYSRYGYQDILVQISRAVVNEFGHLKGKQGWFGPQCAEIKVITGFDATGNPITEDAFYGRFTISTFENAEGSISINSKGEVTVNITAKKKYSGRLNSLFNNIDTRLRTDSIYMGQSVIVKKSSDFEDALSFEIIKNRPSDKIILNDKPRNIVNMITNDLHSPKRRYNLFYGKYGTGKSETCMQIGVYMNQKMGLPFFYIEDYNAVVPFLAVVGNYPKCGVFIEDIDAHAGGEERNHSLNSVINKIDGPETKGTSIKVFFTTNHPERLAPALRRPGRIDVTVEFDFPTQDKAAEILKVHTQHLEGYETIDWEEAASHLEACAPCFYAEAAHRISSEATSKGEMVDQQTANAIVASMSSQLKLQDMKEEANTDILSALSIVRNFLNEEDSSLLELSSEVLSDVETKVTKIAKHF
jgi:hypothetical protein